MDILVAVSGIVLAERPCCFAPLQLLLTNCGGQVQWGRSQGRMVECDLEVSCDICDIEDVDKMERLLADATLATGSVRTMRGLICVLFCSSLL